jgi:hypothetical protein
LYSLWEKKNETTKQEIEREMAPPLDILDEIGQTYGPTRKLHQALANLVAATIQNLERSRSGANVQGVSIGSPTQNLVPPPMQLPMRIDASLHFERSTRENPTPSSISNLPSRVIATPELPIASLPWNSNVGALTPTLPESQYHPPAVAPTKIPDTESTGVPPSGVFDDSLMWGPSLEWTGGWDDFLNAIAM